MKQLLAIAFITLLALGTGCAWISPSSQTTSDGIQVHGHWTVTVTNPDGTVDAVHEFDNALTMEGTILLAELLRGGTSIQKTLQAPSGWRIWLHNTQSEVPEPHFFCVESINWGSYNGTPLVSVVRDHSTITGWSGYASIRMTGMCTIALFLKDEADISKLSQADKDNDPSSIYKEASINAVITRADITNPVNTLLSSIETTSILEFSGKSIDPIILEHSQQLTITVRISFN